MTLEEIGERFGLTRERVRQIKEKAIRRLRHTSRSKLLKTYFVSTWVMRFPNRIFCVARIQIRAFIWVIHLPELRVVTPIRIL